MAFRRRRSFSRRRRGSFRRRRRGSSGRSRTRGIRIGYRM